MSFIVVAYGQTQISTLFANSVVGSKSDLKLELQKHWPQQYE